MSSTSNRGSITSSALAFAFVSTVGGCSSESSSDGEGADSSRESGGSGATRLPNPCTLATYAELEPIVGVTIVRSQEIGGLAGGDPSCTWYDAENYAQLQLALWDETIQYESTKEDDRSVPLSGVGAEAFLSYGYTVHVMTTKGNTFFAQGLAPVADGQVSSEIQSAASAEMMPELLEYEAAFRLAKLVVNEL